MSIELKREQVQQVADSTQSSEAVFLVKVDGITVAGLQDLRSELRKDEARMKVVKVRLIKRAFAELGCVENDSELEDTVGGQVAVVFAKKDCPLIAKSLVGFGKQKEGGDFVVGAVYKGKFLKTAQVTSLSKLPPYEVLIQRCAGSIAAPLVGVATTLNEVVAGLARVLKRCAEAKG